MIARVPLHTPEAVQTFLEENTEVYLEGGKFEFDSKPKEFVVLKNVPRPDVIKWKTNVLHNGVDVPVTVFFNWHGETVDGDLVTVNCEADIPDDVVELDGRTRREWPAWY